MLSGQIADVLAEHAGRSILMTKPFPYENWGRSGGFSRLRYPHSSVGRRIIRIPVPRRLPVGVAFAGGSAPKLLARHHVEGVLRVAESRSDLVAFWKRAWTADETFVPSILNTPAFVPDWATHHVPDDAWYMAWNEPKQKSPPWLGAVDFPTLRAAAQGKGGAIPRLFARKFSTGHDTVVLDMLDVMREESRRP
jgi:hypothetical protein